MKKTHFSVHTNDSFEEEPLKKQRFLKKRKTKYQERIFPYYFPNSPSQPQERS